MNYSSSSPLLHHELKSKIYAPSQISDLVSPIVVSGRRIESSKNTEVILTCAANPKIMEGASENWSKV
jgi:patatin-like phospholipase/acyl hydrolase